MSMMTNGGPAGAPQSQLGVLAQYIKDFSFENPNAPHSLVKAQQQGQPPEIKIQIDVEAKPLSETDFEVELKLEGKAQLSDMVLFGFELIYAGIFRLQNIPQENMGPLLMIECPRLLFPFAREQISSAINNSGYPPLMLEPVDFVAIYQQKMAGMQSQPPA